MENCTSNAYMENGPMELELEFKGHIKLGGIEGRYQEGDTGRKQ